MFKYINILFLLCALLATFAAALPTERSPRMLEHMRRNDWDAEAAVPRELNAKWTKLHARAPVPEPARYERVATANGAPSAAAKLRPRAQMGKRTWTARSRVARLTEYEPVVGEQ